jgi:hypothetical protein
LDAEGGGEPRVGVGVELGQLDPAVALGDRALEHRPELAAGPTPLGPEVHDHRHLAGALDDVLLEGGLVDVLDRGHGSRIVR